MSALARRGGVDEGSQVGRRLHAGPMQLPPGLGICAARLRGDTAGFVEKPADSNNEVSMMRTLAACSPRAKGIENSAARVIGETLLYAVDRLVRACDPTAYSYDST